MTAQETWRAKAAACELASLSFRYPSEELIEPLREGEWEEAAREIAAEVGAVLPAEFAHGLAEEIGELSAEDLLHSLRAEATRLFIGAPKPVVSPYEGVWRAEDDGVQALLFVNPHTMDVERFFKKCGLGQPEGTNEPLDYAATELEFLQFAASLAAGIVVMPETSPAAEDWPGGSPEKAFGQFIDEHVSTWMPRFAEAVKESTRLPYYRAAAEFLGAVLTVL